MKFQKLDDARAAADETRKSLRAIFDEAGPDMDMDKVKSVSGDSAAKVAEIRRLNDELDDRQKSVEELQSLQKAAEAAAAAPGAPGVESGAEPGDDRNAGRGARKSIGELFTASPAFKGRQGPVGPEAHLDVSLKAVFETDAGWAPETTRTGRVVEYATRPVQVTDLIPATTTAQAAVVYMEETTFTNNAAEVEEGGGDDGYPESALELTEQSSPVRKIATYLPVTDEQLEDVTQAQGYINNRLQFMLRQRLDAQILTGNGTAPNLRGILNTTNVQSQAKGTDPTPDAVYKAMTKVRVTGRAMPGAVIFHPNDWQDVRLLRTADGIYIWGSPSDAGPDRIWGLPVAQSDAITENTALVGDYANFSELSSRRGIDVQVSNSHSDYFVNGKQAVRADVRVALIVYRPTAFCKVTGL